MQINLTTCPFVNLIVSPSITFDMLTILSCNLSVDVVVVELAEEVVFVSIIYAVMLVLEFLIVAEMFSLLSLIIFPAILSSLLQEVINNANNKKIQKNGIFILYFSMVSFT